MCKFCTGFSVGAHLSPQGILDNVRRYLWLLTSGEVVLASHGGGQTCCKTSCNAQNSLQQRRIQPQNVSRAETEKPWSRQTLQQSQAFSTFCLVDCLAQHMASDVLGISMIELRASLSNGDPWHHVSQDCPLNQQQCDHLQGFPFFLEPTRAPTIQRGHSVYHLSV